MKIQFELGQASHQRHFTSIFDELNRRGHAVIKTASTEDCPGLVKFRVAEGDHRKLLAFDAFVRDDEWGRLAYLTRSARDYLRYLKQAHADSLTIKERIKNMLELGIPDIPYGVGGKLSKALSLLVTEDAAADQLDVILGLVEDLIPVHHKILEHLRNINADLLCITPYIVTQYGQADLVKAANALGTPVIFMVGSWDNLTSKGTVQIVPDHTLVWNEVQRNEAFLYHGIQKNTVYPVGAARFDEFWERRIEIDRLNYCRLLGLDPVKPIVTYLGSSNLISSDERQFVQRWIEGLRATEYSDLATANIVLRPHPKFAKGWKETFSGQRGVGVALSRGSVLDALNNDSELFHCLVHSRLVVGANTSAELEAAILGKPVFTVEDGYFRSGQAGTVHFRYLAGPLARLATSLEEHYAQLTEQLMRPEESNVNEEFIRNFLRPGGLDRRASEVTVDVIENLVNFKGEPVRGKDQRGAIVYQNDKNNSFVKMAKRWFGNYS